METLGPVTQVQQTNQLPRTYQYVDQVTKVIRGGADGKDIVQQTNYTVTVYDVNGRTNQYTNVHTVDYLI